MASNADPQQVEQTLQNKIVFSFLRYLSELSKSNTEGVDSESLEVAVQCLSEAFNINLNNEDHKSSYDIEPSITTVFKYGLAVASGNNPMMALVKKALDANITAAAQPKVPEKTEEEYFEEKFQQYLEHLKEKQYFAGTEPGSEEYNQRVEKARSRLEAEEKAAEASRLEEAERKKQLGNELLQQKKIDEAIVAYNEAIQLNPKSAIFYANRAAAYSQLKQHDKAIEDCQAALRVDPNYIKAYSRLGLAYFSLEKYEDSVRSYEKAVSIEPNNESLKQSLAVARKKLASVAPAHSHSCGHAHGEHGHSHGEHGHSHAGMPDFSALLNNPAVQNMVNTFQQSTGGEGAPPSINDILRNPQFMQQAGEMMSNPEMAGLLNNPGIMNMASNLMKNPEMMNMLGGFMGRKPPGQE